MIKEVEIKDREHPVEYIRMALNMCQIGVNYQRDSDKNSAMKQVETILNDIAQESGFDNWEQYFECFRTTEPGRRVINKGIRKAVTKALFLSDVMLSCPYCGKDVTAHNGLGDFICSHCFNSWRHEA